MVSLEMKSYEDIGREIRYKRLYKISEEYFGKENVRALKPLAICILGGKIVVNPLSNYVKVYDQTVLNNAIYVAEIYEKDTHGDFIVRIN